MSPHLVGYTRVSTNQQDLSSQQAGRKVLGVPDELVYVDHGLTGRNNERPGLQQALATCRTGDSLAITKLDRSLPRERDIVENLTKHNIKLSPGISIHDPADPVSKLLFDVLPMAAEIESDLIRARTRAGMQIAKAKGRLRGKQANHSKAQENHLVALHQGGQHTSVEFAELFGIARSTVYRIVQRTPGDPGNAGPQDQEPIQKNELPA